MSRLVNTTALERTLAGNRATVRPTPMDALRVARRRWLTGDRFDTGALARELRVCRATLYSWVGSREKLIGEVLWSFAEEGLRQARAAATGSGPDRPADVFQRFIHLNARFKPLRCIPPPVGLPPAEHVCLLWAHAKPALERGDSGGMRSVLALRVPLRA